MLLSVLGCSLTALSDWFSSPVSSEAVIESGPAPLPHYILLTVSDVNYYIVLPPYLIKQD